VQLRLRGDKEGGGRCLSLSKIYGLECWGWRRSLPVKIILEVITKTDLADQEYYQQFQKEVTTGERRTNIRNGER